MLHIGAKTVAAAGTAEPLASTHTPAMWVRVQAKVGNTGYIYVGDSTVAAANGQVLVRSSTGQETPHLDHVLFPPCGNALIYDLALIYIDASVNAEGVNFAYGK